MVEEYYVVFMWCNGSFLTTEGGDVKEGLNQLVGDYNGPDCVQVMKRNQNGPDTLVARVWETYEWTSKEAEEFKDED